MDKETLARSINRELNPPNVFTLDPILIASIISIIIQIIKLIYDYKNPKQMLDDVQNPGIMRRIYLSYKISKILATQNSGIGTFTFLQAARKSLSNKTVLEIQDLMDSCK